MNWRAWAEQVNTITPGLLPTDYAQVTSGKDRKAPPLYQKAEEYFHFGKHPSEFVKEQTNDHQGEG